MPGHAKGKEGPARRFLSLVAAKLEVPATEIIVHFVVTVLSVLSIALIEILLRVAGLDEKEIPWINITLGDWMFYFEVTAATAILAVGIFKAVLAIGKAP
jgi:hypothetical protein